MDCRNETLAFIDDYYSYGLIGLVGVALLLYMIYLVIYIGTDHFSSSNSIYLNFSQLSLLLILLSPLTFIVRSSTSMESICSMRTLSVQILPFCLLLGFNVDFIDQCLLKINQAKAHRYLQNISSFLIFLLAILIQTIILLIWFYQQDEINWFYPICKNECYQKSLLYSMSFQYFLLIFYGIQSTIRFHLSSNPSNFISLLISLLITTLTVLTVSLYLFVPLRNYVSQALSDETILGYSLTLFGYSFLCPMLFGQIYQVCRRRKSTKIRQITKMNFRCLSLSKEQQRAFMAAYIKRNLTASCENLTRTMRSSSVIDNLTRHSTLSVDSLCPTLISTISQDLTPTIKNDSSLS